MAKHVKIWRIVGRAVLKIAVWASKIEWSHISF